MFFSHINEFSLMHSIVPLYFEGGFRGPHRLFQTMYSPYAFFPKTNKMTIKDHGNVFLPETPSHL